MYMDSGIVYNNLLPVCVPNGTYEKRRKFSAPDRNTLLPFLLLFSFFSLTGFLYSDLNIGIQDAFAGFTAYVKASGYDELFGQCALAVSMFVVPVALSGMTVFGRVVSVLAFSLAAFAAGAVTSCSASFYVTDSLQRFILTALLCSALAVADLFFCRAVFAFSKRAFAGKKELFLLSPLLSYTVFILIVYSVNLLFTYIYVIFVKS